MASSQAVAASPPEQNLGKQASAFPQPQQRNKSIDTVYQNAPVANSNHVDAALAPTSQGLSLVNGMVSPPTLENPHFFKSCSGGRTIDHVTVNQVEINELFRM